MEKQPGSPEWINPQERKKLLRRTQERAEWFRAQLAAAPRGIRERYVPVLTAGSLLEYDELELNEREHLQKILAIESGVLDTIPEGIGGISELRQFVEQTASSELAQWQEVTSQVLRSGLPQPWRNARNDAQKLRLAIAEAESAK